MVKRNAIMALRAQAKKNRRKAENLLLVDFTQTFLTVLRRSYEGEKSLVLQKSPLADTMLLADFTAAIRKILGCVSESEKSYVLEGFPSASSLTDYRGNF